MIRRPPISTRTDTLFPYTTLFRSFQVSGSRAADRRLAAAGKRTVPVVGGRLGTCLGLAVVASVGGLAALAARSGLNDPGRAVAATLLVGVIDMVLGVLVGAVVRSDMNGSIRSEERRVGKACVSTCRIR